MSVMKAFKFLITLILALQYFGGSPAFAQSDLNSSEVGKHLKGIPNLENNITWPYSDGFVRIDTLSRRPDKTMLGRWATDLNSACQGSTGFAVAPPESKWTNATGSFCPDGELVIHTDFASPKSATVGATTTKSRPAKSYIRLFCCAGGGCSAGRRNQRAENTHDSCAIKATYEFRNANNDLITRSRKFEPGQKQGLTFCNCGAVKVVGARYINC